MEQMSTWRFKAKSLKSLHANLLFFFCTKTDGCLKKKDQNDALFWGMKFKQMLCAPAYPENKFWITDKLVIGEVFTAEVYSNEASFLTQDKGLGIAIKNKKQAEVYVVHCLEMSFFF